MILKKSVVPTPGYDTREALVHPEYIPKILMKRIKAGKFAYKRYLLKDFASLLLRIMLNKITKYTTATN
jgi:hypothetical protein